MTHSMVEYSQNPGNHTRLESFKMLGSLPNGNLKDTAKKRRDTLIRNRELKEIHLRSPSKRIDTNHWRQLEDHEWRRLEYVGYYLCAYRRIFGEEDPFFVRLGEGKKKELPSLYGFVSHIESLNRKYQMTISDFKKYTIHAINECKKYSKKYPDNFWFFTIYKKENLYNRYLASVRGDGNY